MGGGRRRRYESTKPERRVRENQNIKELLKRDLRREGEGEDQEPNQEEISVEGGVNIKRWG